MWCQYGLYSDWTIEVNAVGMMIEHGLTMLYSRFGVRKFPSRARIRVYMGVYVYMCVGVCVWTYAHP